MEAFLNRLPRRLMSLVALGLMLCVASDMASAATPPKGAPKELKLGFVDFFSGSAAVFGISGKNTAKWMVDKWNNEGGIRGVKVKLTEVDENLENAVTRLCEERTEAGR